MELEAFKGEKFWQDARNGLFVRNIKWRDVIESLPARVSGEFVSKKSTSSFIFSGEGVVAGSLVEVRPDPSFFKVEYGYIQWYYLNWMFSFLCVESLTKSNPPFHADWDSRAKQHLSDNLHILVYTAAVLFLFEKMRINKADVVAMEEGVREQVRDIAVTLYSKTADYGEGFRRHGIGGMVPRLWDKMARYSQLNALGRDANYEPKIDSTRDLLGYSVIAWSLYYEMEMV